MHPALVSPYRQAADGMIETAFCSEGSAQGRLQKLETLGRATGDLLLNAWIESPSSSHHGIHAASTLACQPALEALVHGKLTYDVAEQVNTNLQYFNRFLRSEGLLATQDPEVIGELSELAILSLMWWGFANGHGARNNYAVPATAHQDNSSGIGLRDGIDIRGKYGGKKIAVQVKTSERRTAEIYAPGIVLVSPSQLTRAKRKGTTNLLNAHADNTIGALAQAFENLKQIIIPKKKSRPSI